jgi:carboxymethylenebutenolidase
VLLAGADQDEQAIADHYAAEGYVVLCPEAKIDETGVAAAVAALRGRGECTGKVGALGFGRGGRLAYLAAAEAGVDCAVVYCGTGIEAALDLVPRIRCPLVMHFAENDPEVRAEVVARLRAAFDSRREIGIHVYPGVGGGFERPAGTEYDKPAARPRTFRVRSLLRHTLGPHYDLKCCGTSTRSLNSAPGTSPRRADDGARALCQPHPGDDRRCRRAGTGSFLCAPFHPRKCPADFKLTPISRTIGADRLVDDGGCRSPTTSRSTGCCRASADRKYVEVPTVAIVNFRGDKPAHEHILLGPGERFGADRAARPGAVAGRGRRDREKLVDETRPRTR